MLNSKEFASKFVCLFVFFQTLLKSVVETQIFKRHHICPCDSGLGEMMHKFSVAFQFENLIWALKNSGPSVVNLMWFKQRVGRSLFMNIWHCLSHGEVKMKGLMTQQAISRILCFYVACIHGHKKEKWKNRTLSLRLFFMYWKRLVHTDRKYTNKENMILLVGNKIILNTLNIITPYTLTGCDLC